MRNVLYFAAMLVWVLLPTTGYADDCPNRGNVLRAAVKLEQSVENYSRLARSGRIESRQSMYGSSEAKLNALRGDVRKILIVARALSGSAEDLVMLKRDEGNDISKTPRSCEFPEKDLKRLREDFEVMSMEIGQELTPQRTSLKMVWREVEVVYREFEAAIRP